MPPRSTPRNTSQARRRNRRAVARRSAARIKDSGVLLEDASLRASLIASGDAAPALLSTYDLSNGTPAERFFHAAALEAGFDELDSDWWPSESAETLAMTDDVVFRVGDHQQVVRLTDGTLALVRGGYGSVGVTTAGPSGRDAIAALRDAYPASYLTMAEDPRVPITFWMMGGMGPVQRLRRIEAQPWADVERNYGGDARAELARVMAWESGDDANGQLLLWQGLPGTGKTWALRALASQWAPWAEFHYITDPDVFFGQRSSYMIDVLLSDSYMALDSDTGDVYDEEGKGGKWKVLILEDTGDLLASNARDSYSAGLSRLLNVVDGMIGQGLRVLALVTTNDQLDDFHPAVTRPGRCASQLTFGPLTAEEATEWLHGTEVDREMTLAELYARDEAGREAELAMGACSDCGHAFAAHTGTDGPCDAGDCDCGSYAEPASSVSLETHHVPSTAGIEFPLDADADADADPAGEPLATAFVRIRPDLSGFQQEIESALAMARTTAIADRLAGLAEDEALAERILEGIPDEHAETIRLRLSEFRLVADGAIAPPIPPEHAPGESLPSRRRGPTTRDPVPPVGSGPDNAGVVRWQAILCPEGVPTDDGRVFAPDSIEWRQLPLTLMAMIETQDGHDGAQVSGRIDRIWKEGANVMGEGVFDAGEFGQEIARMVGDGTLRGVSVDIAILAMELAYRSDVLDAQGNWIAGATDAVQEATDDDSPLDPEFDQTSDDLMLVVWRGKIGAATVCPFPAFADASIELASLAAGGVNPLLWRYTHQAGYVVRSTGLRFTPLSDLGEYLMNEPLIPVDDGAPEDPVAPLVASATDAPLRPPAAWFQDPKLDVLTAPTVDEDGRYFGHAAAWDTCHIGIPDVCTTAPVSHADYAYYHLKEVELEDGRLAACGTVTLDTGHAGKGLGRVAATRHYDDTGTAVADVVCGEDEFGIWFSGAVRPYLTDVQLRALRGASLSGDWRSVNGNLELVGLLCVNVPGFPVPRVRALVAAGEGGTPEVLALVAAGVHRGGKISRLDGARLRALLAQAEGTFDDLEAAVA